MVDERVHRCFHHTIHKSLERARKVLDRRRPLRSGGSGKLSTHANFVFTVVKALGRIAGKELYHAGNAQDFARELARLRKSMGPRTPGEAAAVAAKMVAEAGKRFGATVVNSGATFCTAEVALGLLEGKPGPNGLDQTVNIEIREVWHMAFCRMEYIAGIWGLILGWSMAKILCVAPTFRGRTCTARAPPA
jgi:hypothetical protein